MWHDQSLALEAHRGERSLHADVEDRRAVDQAAIDVVEEPAQRVDLRWRGNFAPPRRDPLSAWYTELLREAGIAG